MGELRVIRVDGDIDLSWSRDNAEEVAAARQTFTKYANGGWLAFGETSGEAKLMFNFDPEVDKITLAPPIMGG